jgi:hypothetical protein
VFVNNINTDYYAGNAKNPVRVTKIYAGSRDKKNKKKDLHEKGKNYKYLSAEYNPAQFSFC